MALPNFPQPHANVKGRNQMKYTFYGDLLGIGSAYKLGPHTAYDKLNVFYNETFRTLDAFCDVTGNEVEMFSDSLFIKGDHATSAILHIALVFSNLLRKGLLLRGAIVSGKLNFDTRLTKPKFVKRLPEDDTLARAVGLEKMQKGARFLIEPQLANELLKTVPDWRTHEGYLRSIRSPADESLRKICPTPDSMSFEYLYYWSNGVEIGDYATRIMDLKDIMAMCDKASREHYKETIALIERSSHRHKTTMKRLANAVPCILHPAAGPKFGDL